MTATLPQFVRDLLASPPHRGGGLNNWFYRVARVLHPYRSSGEIVELLRAATAGEPIKHGEIARAVERSAATAWKPGQPTTVVRSAWPKVNHEQREAIIRDGGGLVDLWEQSPVRIEDNASHTEELIDALFPGNPLLCCGKNRHFATRSREEWTGKLSAVQLIVPSPMIAREGLTQEGKRSAHTLSITGPRRFLVVEFDQGDVDDHAALLLHLKARATQPKLLRLDPDARAIFIRYYNACGDAAIEGDERIEAAWSKLSGYAARLALVGQLARNPDAESVTGEVMQAACDLARWFGDEAIRIYATLTETKEQRDQRRLVEFIESRGGSVTVRGVTQSFRPLKNQRDKTEAAFNGLAAAGLGNWGPIGTTDKGGRPTRKFQLLPLSTSTKPPHLRGKTGGIVDVDTPNVVKIAGNNEQDLDPVPAAIEDEGPDESWTYD